jgi:hypothetical protein
VPVSAGGSPDEDTVQRLGQLETELAQLRRATG